MGESPSDRWDHSAGPYGGGQELLVKDALHIQMIHSEKCFNQDGGLDVPGCWITVMRRQGGAIPTDL